MSKPKVLVLSLNAWRADSGIHTLTDFFTAWDKEKLAQLYTKSQLPNTPVCDYFFQISENAVIKSVFKRKPVGRRVSNTADYNDDDAKRVNQEKALYSSARKRHSWFMTLARECVWRFGCWKSNELDQFIEEEAPDMYFVPIYPVAYMGWIQLYILKKYPKPYVCYLADDNYSYKVCGGNPLSYLHRFILRKPVKKLAMHCNEMFTITAIEGRETDRDFGTHSVVLTKAIDYSNLTYQEIMVHKPIKMVYTGKLVIGRASSLASISNAMQRINARKIRVEFDIYSQDVVDKATMQLLNSNGCHFRGSVPKEQVASIQDEADIVVFVESLEKKYRYAARLSFSTKLTDYFKSGKCILAIGDETIAPIKYLQENDAAVIATSYEEIYEQLNKLIERKDYISEYGKKAFECGKRNHSKEYVQTTFIETMNQAASQQCKLKRRGNSNAHITD